jgi:uncharacterized protein (TIGR03083 family)
MEFKRLLECLDNDHGRLREVALAGDLTAQVPSCPDWSLADLVQHVGMVYLHKVQCMREGNHPAAWPPPGTDQEPPIELLERAYADLVAEFAKRDPGEPTFTWYGRDQSVGFWIRRMSQESLIHRVDAELAAGGSLAPIPADLALDGIDEFLVAFVEYGSHEWLGELGGALAGADGRAIRIEAADSAWFVRPTPEGVQVRVSHMDSAEAVVRGEPRDVLLWVWRRVGDDAVAISGDADAVTNVRRAFVAVSQ